MGSISAERAERAERRAWAVAATRRALEALAALVWIALLARLLGGGTPLDRVASSGPLVLFVLIPVGWAACGLLGRGAPRPLPEARRRAVRRSNAFLAATWGVCSLPVLLWAGLHAAIRLPRDEGPDSAYARETFERALRLKPPAGVSRIHARDRWEFGDGNRYWVRARLEDRGALDAIVASLRVHPLERARSGVWKPDADDPPWWPSGGRLAGAEAWGWNDARPCLLLLPVERLLLFHSR